MAKDISSNVDNYEQSSLLVRTAEELFDTNEGWLKIHPPQ
jgi:hypothetical protein